MPNPTGIRVADVLAILLDVGDQQNILVLRVSVVGHELTLHRSKPVRKGYVLCRRQRLITDTEHGACVEGCLQCRECFVADTGGKIQVFDRNADRGAGVGNSNETISAST